MAKKATTKPKEEGEVLEATPTNPVSSDKTIVATPKPKSPENAMAIIGGVSTAVLEEALKTQSQQRELIKKFIQDHLEKGIDFGSIHVVKQDKCPNPYTCKNSYHFSKPVLFKPGQEKLFSLFQITSELIKDEEAYEMLPDYHNLIAYKCIMKRNGQQIGEGRGSASVGDKGRDVNASIKIAEKRARMDACLSLGFSEYFSQDLDDPDYKTAAEAANRQAEAEAAAKESQEPATDNERAQLAREFAKAHYTSPDEQLEVLKRVGISKPKEMNRGQIREVIRIFQAGEIEPKASGPLDTVVKDIPDHIDPDDFPDGPPAPAQAAEPELIVDDDLKTHTQELYEQIGLNEGFGKQWFMKTATGRPFARWEQFQDDDWRKAYQFVMDILELRVQIEDRYLDDTHKTGPQTGMKLPYKE